MQLAMNQADPANMLASVLWRKWLCRRCLVVGHDFWPRLC
jgi:hypothetical protein